MGNDTHAYSDTYLTLTIAAEQITTLFDLGRGYRSGRKYILEYISFAPISL